MSFGRMTPLSIFEIRGNMTCDILVCDFNPREAARALDDRTLSVQLIETASILSTALHNLGLWQEGMSKALYVDHKSVLWVSLTKNNFRWMAHLGLEMVREFEFRFHKRHGSARVIQFCWDVFRRQHRPFRNEFTGFLNGTEFTQLPPVTAYRKLLCEKRFNSLSIWTNRQRPSWYYRLQRAS